VTALGIDQAKEFRDFCAANPDALDSIFNACTRPVVYSRHHWLSYKGEYRVRADLKAEVELARTAEPASWDLAAVDLLLALFVLDIAAVGLDDLPESASSAAVRETLLARHRLYSGALGTAEEPPATLVELAHAVSRTRSQVEVDHELYSIIDGKIWYRTEGVIRRDEIDPQDLTPTVASALGELAARADGQDVGDWLRAITGAAVAESGESAGVLRVLMRAALVDPLLRADHVTLTCPIGDRLDRLEEMTTSDSYFTETQLHADVVLDEDRLGHASEEQLQRTIRARMLKLKRGAIRSLYGPGCMQGQFIEKHGGHMIFRNEDAHYRGHQSIGCSSGGRVSFGMLCPEGCPQQEITQMVGDFRAVRMSQDEADVFQADDLRHLLPYAHWIRTVVDETFRLGAVVKRGVA